MSVITKTNVIRDVTPQPITAVAHNQPLTGNAESRPATSAHTSIAAQVRAAAPKVKMRGVSGLTTEIMSPFFHCILYGETDARKSVTAAHFGTPENVRIIMTRRPEQLIALKGEPYKYYVTPDSQDLETACLYPEAIWPEWTSLDPTERTIIIDDMTEGKELFLEANSMIESHGQVREVRDPRKMYAGATGDVRDMFRGLLARKHHLIVIATAKVYTNDITHEETVSPDLPPQMMRVVSTDFEFCFFIDKRTFQLLTRQRFDTWKELVNGREQTHSRQVFAKNKIPLAQARTALLEYEKLDLRAVWNKVVAAGAQ